MVAGKRGPIPKYCETCRYANQLEASQRWKGRNRDALNATRRTSWTNDPEATEKAKERHRRWYAANRERVSEYRRRLYSERQAETGAATVAAYRRANPGKQAEIENRRRARLLGQFVAPVKFEEIWQRDGGICQLCHLPIAQAEASLDHIVPLARGGTHEPANVQLAHRRCNSRKGAR